MRVLYASFLILLLAGAAGAASPPVPTFARDVAPLIYQNCSPCHRPGEAAPFSLLTYRDVKRRARQIASVTESRYMPPWLPEAGYAEFADTRTLTRDQIKLIVQWVRAGAPEGNGAETPPVPAFPTGWQLGKPDLILTAPKPFEVPAAGPDVFWNFIYTPDVKVSRYVRAVEIRPGDAAAVHHANLLVDPSGSSRRREAEPGAGFPGMEVALERTSFDFDSHFLFWKPGSVPYSEPDGLAWTLRPGASLVLNTHLQPSGKPRMVQPSVGLYFTDHPPDRFPLLMQLEHDGALDIPAGARDFTVADDFRMPLDADALAVYPHAHYLGKLLEAYATLPDGRRVWLIRIPDWNLAWQAVYRYRKPIFLPRGTVVSMRYHYDNSAANPRNPNHPPKRVRAGNQAADEMGHLWLQVLPRGRGDHRMALEEALLEHRLGKYPGDYWASLKLGAVRLARLDAPGALPYLEAAVRAEPDQPEAHNLFGAALRRVGRARDAIQQFETALRLRPDYQNARFNLANALAESGKLPEAIAEYRHILAIFPNDTNVQLQLDRALQRLKSPP
jgi:mono/diheme cytochrome c family protein